MKLLKNIPQQTKATGARAERYQRDRSESFFYRSSTHLNALLSAPALAATI